MEECALFASDPSFVEVQALLQSRLSDIKSWTRENKISFNVHKRVLLPPNRSWRASL
jgi:hypothetical protein